MKQKTKNVKKRYEKQLNKFKYKGESVKITLGTFLLMCISILLLIMATFTQITLKHPYVPFDAISFLSLEPTDYQISQHFTKVYNYIPQIPVLFFILTLLGSSFTLVTVCAYILLGMFFPVFALGGGISYIFEYGFGYILAYIPVCLFSGTLLKLRDDFIRVIIVSVCGVLAIHILGVLYMLFIATLRHASADLIWSWISSQSGIQVFYDIFFTIIAIFIGKLAKKVLWVIMCE